MCTQFCPTGALASTVNETDATVTLWFCAARCTGCGLCENVCFKRAVTLNDEVELSAVAACKSLPVWNGKPTFNPLNNMAKEKDKVASVMRTFVGGQSEST
jgi:formate hydrogenlyase subunit 6/NADH:ubiquinone oxidoreductase subunit I